MTQHENESAPSPSTSTDEPKNILVAVDATPGAARVLNMSVTMSRAMPAATIHLLHVHRGGRGEGSSPAAEDALADAKEHLAYCTRTIGRRAQVPIVEHLAVGDPKTEVLRMAAKVDADVLVIGTHDHGSVGKLLLGSLARTLMREVGCSVVVVKQ